MIMTSSVITQTWHEFFSKFFKYLKMKKIASDADRPIAHFDGTANNSSYGGLSVTCETKKKFQKQYLEVCI